MRWIKILTVLMGVAIVIGTTVVVVTIIKRAGTSSSATVAVVLDEPAGTRIGGIASVSDRLAVLLQGAGPDRIVLIDPRTGGEAGTIALAR